MPGSFTRLTNDLVVARRRVILNDWGLDKGGKTHFALTFASPDFPLFYIDLDNSAEGTVEKFIEKGCWIEYTTYGLKADAVPASYAKVLAQFQVDFDTALDAAQSTPGATVVVDTGAQLWDVVQVAKLEEVRKRRTDLWVSEKDPDKRAKAMAGEIPILPLDYRESNALMARYWSAAQQAKGVNVIFTNRAKDVYDDKGKKTGDVEMDGWKWTMGAAQMSLYHYKVAGNPQAADPTLRAPKFKARISSCRFEPMLEGLVIDQPDAQKLREYLWG